MSYQPQVGRPLQKGGLVTLEGAADLLQVEAEIADRATDTWVR